MHRMTSLALLIAFAMIAIALPSAARAQTPALTIDALKNGTYAVDVVPGGSAKLANGHFDVAAAPGSASKATADFVTGVTGTIGGQPGGAVVLASSGGGSGTFFDLYVVDATGKTLAKDRLGDRVVVRSLSTDTAGNVTVDLLTHGPNEPLTSATQPERRVHALVGGMLVRLAPAPAATGNAGLDTSSRSNIAFEVIALTLVVLAMSFARTRTGGAR